MELACQLRSAQLLCSTLTTPSPPRPTISLPRLAALSQEASVQAQLKQSLGAALNKTAALTEVWGGVARPLA